MTNKNNWLRFLVIIITFVIIIVGCNNCTTDSAANLGLGDLALQTGVPDNSILASVRLDEEQFEEIKNFTENFEGWITGSLILIWSGRDESHFKNVVEKIEKQQEVDLMYLKELQEEWKKMGTEVENMMNNYFNSQLQNMFGLSINDIDYAQAWYGEPEHITGNTYRQAQVQVFRFIVNGQLKTHRSAHIPSRTLLVMFSVPEVEYFEP